MLRHFKQERSIPEVPLALPDEGVNLKALLYQTEKEFYQQALAKAGGNSVASIATESEAFTPYFGFSFSYKSASSMRLHFLRKKQNDQTLVRLEYFLKISFS